MGEVMLVGVCGKKQHGKDSIGDWLNARYGLVKDRFAQAIKQAMTIWFNLSHRQVHGDLKEVIDERWGRTPREILQLLGTEVARQIHPDVWARAAMKRHRARGRNGTVLVDCRFPNEARIIREEGGVLIYVVRPGLSDNEFSGHPSETAIEEIGRSSELQILNDGTLEDLQDKVAYLERDLSELFGVR